MNKSIKYTVLGALAFSFVVGLTGCSSKPVQEGKPPPPPAGLKGSASGVHP